MARPKPMNRQRRDDLVRSVEAMREALPTEVKHYFVAVIGGACDLAEKHQLNPRQMAIAAAGMVGIFAMADARGDVHADQQIDDFLEFADVAMSVAVAGALIAGGWRPAGKH